MSKEFKDTLLMPETDFKMKGGLGTKEPLIQKEWEEKDLYNKRLAKNEGGQYFVLHDGPPYANGSIHIGHALNKVLKDMIIRYKSLKGFKSPYIPGWDTHGLPIENALTKSGKVDRKKMSVSDFRKKCEEYALKQIDIQREQFKRLGILGEWDNPYKTLDRGFEAEQIRVFGKMAEKGLIFKGLKPVYWSPSSESALAEAEIEYHDKKSPSIYVAMKVVDTKGIVEEGTEFVIWTTTPWTIPANLAIAVGEDLDYSLVEANGRKLVLGTALVEGVMSAIAVEEYKVLKSYKGAELEGIIYEHPYEKRLQPVVLGHHVTDDGGTGVVHIAPGHGEDDFLIGKKYGLDILCPVNERGIMTAEAGFVEGLFYEEANKEIGMKLEEVGALLKLKFITHSYPHDWRTNQPIIFRATAQWFGSIDKIKDELLKEVKNVKWTPEWGESRLGNMIANRGEWCISRQRVWGVPIPIFYAEDGSEIIDVDLINHVANLFEENGSNIWFDWEIKDLLPKGYSNELSPNGLFTKETDIMDVWFDSGTTHHSAMKKRLGVYPADLYLEGSDQYRGWFNSSLTTGVAATGISPYKSILTHGFVNDANGHKMSKSKGNTMDPNVVATQYGADILRLWVASVDYQSDVRIGDEILKQVAESYRKVRNTFRFILGNLKDFDPKKDKVTFDKLDDSDKYIMFKLKKLGEDIASAYESYEFSSIYKKVNNFLSNELSAYYLDYTKDILYIEKADSVKRRSVQTVLFELIDNLLVYLNPILPHTTSEAYSFLGGDLEDVYLSDYKILDIEVDNDLLDKFNKFMDFRDDILKALEVARNEQIIGKSFNAHVILDVNKEIHNVLTSLNINLQQVLIVSKLTINEASENRITVKTAEGHTCARCWQVVDTVNEDEICERCAEVII